MVCSYNSSSGRAEETAGSASLKKGRIRGVGEKGEDAPTLSASGHVVCRQGRDARFSWKQRRNVVSPTQCFLSVDLDQELGLNCLSCDRRLDHRIIRIFVGFILGLLDVTPGILEGKGRLVGWSVCSTGQFHFLQLSE